MNIRPLYDRIVVKRIDEQGRPRLVVYSFRIPPKRSRKKVKWWPSEKASAWKTARW